MIFLLYSTVESHLHVHRSGGAFRTHYCACDYAPVCVCSAGGCVSIKHFTCWLLDLKHVPSKMVNRLMGHVMKAGLKCADFHLKINALHPCMELSRTFSTS